MHDILGDRTLWTGSIGCFASLIARSVLVEAAEENGAVLAFLTDDQSGVQVLQSFGQLERIRGKTNKNLSLEIVHPALDVNIQINRLKAIQDARPFICVRDYSRDLATYTSDNPWGHWQRTISNALKAKTLTIVHDGVSPIKQRLEWKDWSDVYQIKDGHQNGPGNAPRARVGEPMNLEQAKGGTRVVRLLGKSYPGTIVFDLKPELVTS